MKVHYTRPALVDLDEILTYVALHSPAGARNVQARIKKVIGLLSDFPGAGTRTSDPTIRKMTTTAYPYLIFYEVVADEVVIHAVRHGARSPDDMPV